MSDTELPDLIVLDPEYGPVDLNKVRKLLEKSGVKRAYINRKESIYGEGHYTCVHPIDNNRVDVQEGSDTKPKKRNNPFRILS